MPEFTLTKVKTFIGNEGHGLNAEITMDGKPVAFVLDEANGGMIQVDWFSVQGRLRSHGNDAARAALLQHARAEYEEQVTAQRPLLGPQAARVLGRDRAGAQPPARHPKRTPS